MPDVGIRANSIKYDGGASMNIYGKLMDIQTRLKVEKNKHNDFAGFNYRSCEDILLAVKPFLETHNLSLLLTDDIVCVDGRAYIKATAILTDGETEIKVSALAREPEKPKAKMDESQTTGSTSSYARKYALNGLFALDDGEDSDDTNSTPKTTEKLISEDQIKELKQLGFDDDRLEKMTKYYKKDKLNDVTYKEAEETISKQKKAVKNNG